MGLPDTALLQLIADTLGVTVTELPVGGIHPRRPILQHLSCGADRAKTLYLTAKELTKQGERRRRWKGVFLAACLVKRGKPRPLHIEMGGVKLCKKNK